MSTNPIEPTPTPYPAPTRTSSTTISGVPTTATLISFSDKLLITVSQSGILNHWLHVPLLGASPLSDPSSTHIQQLDASLLPFSHLTATTVLGGTKPEFEVLGQTLAATVASAVVVKTPEEGRMVVFGLGLTKADVGRDEFEGLVGLCLDVL